MKSLFLSVMFLFLLTDLFAITVETAQFEDFLYKTTEECEYDNWISHISEGIADEGYNLYAPYDRQTNGFGNFIIAGEDTLANWQSVITTFLSGNYEGAQILIDLFEFPYEVVEFHDTGTDRIYYLLRENINPEYYDDNGTPFIGDDEHGAFDNGWGLYVYNPSSDMPVVITAPHPTDDFPTPAVSYKCFRDWNAKFLLISGVGREVKWTEVGSYSNSKSLSDPSRINAHPFNVAYKLFCDRIREEFGRREFSAQIHSYDWDRHEGHANCQISAGYNKTCPTLPIRDLSDWHIDIVNATADPVIPGNSIGTHETVFINDFYAVNYEEFDFLYYNTTVPFPVNNSVDLPGYSQNRQMLYTYVDWNKYDVFEPFMHIEMDELPNSYFESEENYKWFYGFNDIFGHFNMQQLFEHTIEYYSNWVQGITDILPQVIELDDGMTPEIPQNLIILSKTFDNLTLNWDDISAFDFWTYEIYYDDEPIVDPQNCQRIDRINDPFLACQFADSIFIEGLEMNQEYYFRMRVRDYAGNFSELSQEISCFTAPVDISDFQAVGGDGVVDLVWTANIQSGNLGFHVYRKPAGGINYLEIASWETDSTLVGSSIINLIYDYQDTTVMNNRNYSYCIASENAEGEIFMYENTDDATPMKIFELYVINQDTTICDTVRFGKNPFATDEYDQLYDIEKEGPTPPEYIYAAFYESQWQTDYMYLSQEIHGEYNPLNDYKIWKLLIRTNQLGDTLSVSVSPDFVNQYGELYLRNNHTQQLVNLTYTSLYYSSDNSAYHPFTLYWGDLKPQIEIADRSNGIYQEGEEVTFAWDISHSSLVENIKLLLCSDEDTTSVVNQLPPNTTEYTWHIPAGLSVNNARLCVQVITNNGEVIRGFSDYKLGVV
ncbi:MAG: fibronectin type III domain-containing protein, partial [Candidatus Cloacimonadota bacterium]|nr:fibronectin type III domain-containing protein [Candidatus Cloacimonadota bacterium]